MELHSLPVGIRLDIFAFFRISEAIGLERVDPKWADGAILFDLFKTFCLNEFYSTADRDADNFYHLFAKINNALKRVHSFIVNIDFDVEYKYLQPKPLEVRKNFV